jgi:hypothetical protein
VQRLGLVPCMCLICKENFRTYVSWWQVFLYLKLYLYIIDVCLYLYWWKIVYNYIWWQIPLLYDLWNMNKWMNEWTNGFIVSTQKPLKLTWLQQNCRMYWPNSKQCTSQDDWNSVAIAGITVWRTKEVNLKGTFLVSRYCCSGHNFGPETVQVHCVCWKRA